MLTILFWVFSVLMLASAAAVVLFRNPVNSAMSLVLSFLALAALFVTLDAYFIGIIQVLVYAGAVMVLFLFIIMLLDLRGEKSRSLNLSATVGGSLAVAGFLAILARVIHSQPTLSSPLSPLPASRVTDVKMIGFTLFHSYGLPFEVVGVLLLSATVGVVVLSRKSLR
jgi:NADH-quinone oxidoreductase subunit J